MAKGTIYTADDQFNTGDNTKESFLSYRNDGVFDYIAPFQLPNEPTASIAITGKYLGRDAFFQEVLGRRVNTFSDTTTLHDTCEFLASGEFVYTKPTLSTTFVINSTSTDDTSAGIGARTVDIIYIDTDGNEQETTVTLNGTSDVAIPAMANNCQFVQYMHVKTLGSSSTAVGNIILYNTAKTIKYEQISAGGNMSLSGRYMVPAGYTGYITNWSCSAIRQSQEARLRTNTDKKTKDLIQPFLLKNAIFLGADTSFVTPKPYIIIAPLSEAKVSSIAQATTSAPRFDTAFTILCIKDT